MIGGLAGALAVDHDVDAVIAENALQAVATSASRGTLSSVSVSSVSRLAIISGKVAFLAPEIGIVPLSRRPPTMRMRSITDHPRRPTPGP